MNKTQFLAALSEKSEVSKKDTAKLFEAMNTVICETLASGDKISIPGFGTFEVKQRAARQARNLHTGEIIQVPAKKVPAFKPSKSMKDSVL